MNAIGIVGTVVITVYAVETGFHWKALDHSTDDLDRLKVGEGNAETVSEAQCSAEELLSLGSVRWVDL